MGAAFRLAPEELEALRELTRGATRAPIPSSQLDSFVADGLARRTADGVTITALGRAYLAQSVWRDAQRF